MAGTEISDLRVAAGACAIERDVVVVRGPDALAFLQGQLSQDVEALAVGETARSFLLQPAGKVDAWLRVARTADDEVVLDVDPGWGAAVEARLRRFLLRTKAELEGGRWTGVALRGPGSAAVATAADPSGVHRREAGWPGVEGVDLLGPDGSPPVDLPTATADVLEGLRIEAGVPAMGAEVHEGTIPAELGQWAIDASASFTKGCYTGQELVARIDSRGGNVPRPVRGLVLDGPVPAGSAVLVDGAEVGHLTSVAASSALGTVALGPLARSVEVGTAVVVDGVSGRVADLPLR
jgi:folate-binding protein YgfZ